MGAQRPADQAARALSSCRRGTGANVAGEASWDVHRRRRESDTRRSECNWLDERSGCENRAGSAVPGAARGKIVIRLRRFVSRCCGNGRGVIRSQAQCVRAKVNGEFADAVRWTERCTSMESWSRALHQQSDHRENNTKARAFPPAPLERRWRGCSVGHLDSSTAARRHRRRPSKNWHAASTGSPSARSRARFNRESARAISGVSPKLSPCRIYAPSCTPTAFGTAKATLRTA